MPYLKILNNFDSAYTSFRRIYLTDQNDCQSPIHPIIRFSAGIVFNSLINKSSSRLLLIFPRRFEAGLWMSVLCSLELMKIDYKDHPDEVTQLKIGQKYLFNNTCYIEFQGIHDKNNIWLNTQDGRITLTLDRLILLQPVDTEKKLSSLKKVNDAYFSAPPCPLDYILDITSFGNRLLFNSYAILVNKIGKTSTYIRENKINACKIFDLLLWGKLDENGSVSIINPSGIDATPNCVISSDLFSAANHIQNRSENVKAVIINSPDYCMNDPQSLDSLLDNNIKIIVTADLLEIDKLGLLLERGFNIWQWNEKNIQGTQQEFCQESSSAFYLFDRSLDLYCNKKINIIECSQPVLEQIINLLFDLDKYISGDHQELKNLYVKLVQIINEISRLARIPSQNWMANFDTTIKNLAHSFKRNRMWLSDEALNSIDEIFNLLADIKNNSFKDVAQKIESLKSVIFTKHPSETIAILLPKDTDREFTYKYWSNNISNKRLRNVQFISPSDLGNYPPGGDLDRIVVCGWFGKVKMYSVLHSLICKDITFILYPFELDWFNSASTAWAKQTHFNIKAADFSETLKIAEVDLKYFDYVHEKEAPPPAKESKIDILDFELKLKKYKYSGYKFEQGTTGIKEKARVLEFSNNQFAFFTESHQALILTKLLGGQQDAKEIPRKNIKDLKVGDYILFRDSDKDLIREIADKKLEGEGLNHILELSGLWKIELHKLYIRLDQNFDKLYELLSKVGCRRHSSTIKGWLFSEHIIGPRYPDDIKLIATAAESEELLTNYENILEAISIVRGAHLQASYYLTKKLLVELPSIFNEHRDYRGSFLDGPIVIELEDFGQIKMLQIEEIGEEWIEVDKGFTNHLISHEVDQWQE